MNPRPRAGRGRAGGTHEERQRQRQARDFAASARLRGKWGWPARVGYKSCPITTVASNSADVAVRGLRPPRTMAAAV